MKTTTGIDDPRIRTSGLLPVDKPAGMTSHDVVAAVRKHVRPLRVGHTGTLDPLADGLLILCVGAATKIARFIETQHKTYRTMMLLGVQTETQDITGARRSENPVEAITEESVHRAAARFVGEIEQMPPAFSAIKLDGVPAYKLARQRKSVALKPRKVNIRRLEIESIRLPRVQFVVECSKGTYVRTLCNDLGATLGVGGCMESLRRLAIGHFTVEDAFPLAGLAAREHILAALVPPEVGLSSMPAVSCTPEQAAALSHGKPLTVTGQMQPTEAEKPWVQAVGPDGELLAVGKLLLDDKTLRFFPKRVLTHPENGGP
jgi:tRNA pseudouridine55 synthase